MSEFEKIQDRIDEYIRGTMSDKDRTIFENELQQNEELRHEVEVQSSISEAVQAVHLKQMLQGLEAELVNSGNVYSSSREENEPISIAATISRIHYWRRFYQWAAVAAAVAIVFFSGNSLRQSHRIKGFGNEYYAELVAPSARDGNSLDNLLALSYSQIGAGDFELANETIAKANELIDDGLSVPVEDEVSEYEHSLFVMKQFEVEWYHALVVMKQGKYREAKKLLKDIADGDGPYVSEAKEILNNMYHIKN